MSTTAREAVTELRMQLAHAALDPRQDKLIVDIEDIEALVRWAEEQMEDADKTAETVVEELKAGDTVEVLIDYISVKRGMQGIIRKVRTSGNRDYPIEVQFPENSLGYWFDDDRVSFNSFELRKV